MQLILCNLLYRVRVGIGIAFFSGLVGSLRRRVDEVNQLIATEPPQPVSLQNKVDNQAGQQYYELINLV